jgi:hypothetical protein
MLRKSNISNSLRRSIPEAMYVPQSQRQLAACV